MFIRICKACFRVFGFMNPQSGWSYEPSAGKNDITHEDEMPHCR